MDTTGSSDVLAHACARAELLPADRSAVDALADAMRGWGADELNDYRDAVLNELAVLGDGPVRGFLAAELAALRDVGASA